MRLYKIKNRAFTVKEMKKYEPALVNVINEIYDFFNYDIPVTFIIKEGSGKQDEHISTAAYVHTVKENFIINIYSDFIKKFLLSNKNYFTSILLHEFAHVYDIYNCLHSKKCSYDSESAPKSEEALLQKIGFDFWTEYFAFSIVFKRYTTKSYPTIKFGIKQSEKARNLLHNFIENKTQKNFVLFLDAAENFVYFLANLYAGYTLGQKRYYIYCDKTQDDKDFIFINNFLESLNKYIKKLNVNTYDKNLKKNLYALGAHIYKYIYKQMGLIIDHTKDGIYTLCYPNDKKE